MRTTTALSYPLLPPSNKRSACEFAGDATEPPRKSPKTSPESEIFDFFDLLPDDILLTILSKSSASGSSPSDLISVILTCQRFRRLGLNPLVLSKASERSLAVRAHNWSDSADQFLKRCADAGNPDACYLLGMIRFYCLGSRSSGMALMARAAVRSHAAALYSLAVIQFNGSGGTKDDKNPRSGAALCGRAALYGHVAALRELGHCLQDGLGVRRGKLVGRWFLFHATARESLAPSPPAGGLGPLLSAFWSGPAGLGTGEPDVANRFLVEWFGSEAHAGELNEGRRLCSNPACGRPETRRIEFRRCSVCGKVNYCSRACQAVHWRLGHSPECVATVDRWLDGLAAGGGL